ncbi:ABC transporter permease [Egicoccus sp. AB-alg2]|uniref:ABC transporter permease n=1 Tax=Egicoccus sp. AB-alg2 TaxID=3242693 RepID=UPI00359DDE58
MSAPAPPDIAAPGPTTAVGSDDAPGRSRLGTALHYLGMPVLLALVLLALYVWVQGLELDAIEARQLRRAVLVGQTTQHVRLTVYSTLIVLALAIPLGIIATRPGTRRLAPAIIGLGNAGQAIPSLGLLALIFFIARQTPLLPSTGTVPVVAALVGYSFLPILRNTMVGLEQVDASVLEAGRGMGMSSWLVLRRLELPLAVPVILAGVRTALVLNVGTATLAFLFGGGGLGRTIFQGFGLQRLPLLVTGAVLVSVLALFVDWLAGLVEERLTPRGL